MPTEPERDIEQTLRDYARHRQATGGTPPALHPATRRLLQDEVARQKSAARRATGLGQFWATWPGFILKGSVALAVLVMGAFLLAPLWRGEPANKQSMTLAKNEPVSEKKTAAGKKELPPTLTRNSSVATTPAPSALRKQANETKADTFKDLAVNPARPAERTRSNPVAAPVATAAPVTAVPTPMPTVAAATPPVTAVDTLAQPVSRAETLAYAAANSVPITQEFLRVNPAAGPRAGRGGRGGVTNRQNLVLRSFRVEQDGARIRVIDSDGSIYTGTVTPPASLAGQLAVNAAAGKPAMTLESVALDQEKAKATQNLSDAGARSIAPPPLSNAQFTTAAGTRPVPSKPGEGGSIAPLAANAPVAAGYAFHVSGTNRTLNQPVEFSGNFVANDQSAAAPTAIGGIGGGGGGRAGGRATGAGGGGGGFAPTGAAGSLAPTNAINGPATNSSPLANFRLQGQAVIGTNQIGINAVPTRP